MTKRLLMAAVLATAAFLIVPLLSVATPATSTALAASSYQKQSMRYSVRWNSGNIPANFRFYFRVYPHHEELYGVRFTVDARKAECIHNAFRIDRIDFHTDVPTGRYTPTLHPFNAHIPCKPHKLTTSYSNVDDRIGETWNGNDKAIMQTWLRVRILPDPGSYGLWDLARMN